MLTYKGRFAQDVIRPFFDLASGLHFNSIRKTIGKYFPRE